MHDVLVNRDAWIAVFNKSTDEEFEAWSNTGDRNSFTVLCDGDFLSIETSEKLGKNQDLKNSPNWNPYGVEFTEFGEAIYIERNKRKKKQ